VILPEAQVKIFLTASPECRAQRRYLELCQKGITTTFEEVLAEMNARDARDSGRAVAPAVAAEDAVLFDNTGMDLEQSVAYVLDLVKEKTGITPPRG